MARNNGGKGKSQTIWLHEKDEQAVGQLALKLQSFQKSNPNCNRVLTVNQYMARIIRLAIRQGIKRVESGEDSINDLIEQLRRAGELKPASQAPLARVR